MKVRVRVPMNALPRHEQGAATLLLVLGLVLLATLASAWSSRAILMDMVSSRTREQARQARNAAQAALATAQAEVMQAFEASSGGDLFADPSLRVACPGDLQGPRWQCARLPLAAGAEVNGWRLGAIAARDLIASPHVWQLRSSARATSGHGQASARESLLAPVLSPVPMPAPEAALLLNGCFSASPGSVWQICPANPSGQSCSGSTAATAVYSHFVPDTDGNGMVSSPERSTCLALTPAQLPGGGSLTSPDRPTSRSPCSHAVWRSVLGEMTQAQLKAWSDAQADNGLSAQSQPPRSIYWIDSPADWTQSLGSPQSPVLLVFSSQACAVRCPRIAAGTQIHGTVLVDAGCRDEPLQGWQAGAIDGLLAIEGGLTAVAGSSQVRARAYARQALSLHWPQGVDPSRVQAIAGSHREGSP